MGIQRTAKIIKLFGIQQTIITYYGQGIQQKTDFYFRLTILEVGSSFPIKKRITKSHKSVGVILSYGRLHT